MITIQNTVKAPIEKVWAFWTQPEHITQWNNASEDWHTPKASNDLTVGGKFCATMASRDGAMSFDFEGTYTAIKELALIEYVIADGRKVSITFEVTPEGVDITESFDPEKVNPEEMQRQGWQNILDNFKKYTEQH
ncbi:SRPBCC family protein [Flavobacterium phycosphaerae]|uniref:SRPBCC family protein n=1 Tax=Flavobacterium phycosphaerae TaxID=2697515 RepID=UPI00138ACCF7|nr:SRPBCC family protein [Flavobacterium phycosphaerae]